jgi:hypothetical protein
MTPPTGGGTMPGEPVDWIHGSPFERLMDDRAAAGSIREVEHLALDGRRDFAGDPRRRSLEIVIDGMRQLLVAGRLDRVGGRSVDG